MLHACLSEHERAIIATWNDITTAEMNGDTHINELLKREAGKPRPERLPKNPVVLPGFMAGNSKARSAPAFTRAPQSPKLVNFADLRQGAEIERMEEIGGTEYEINYDFYRAYKLPKEGGGI